MSNNEGNLKLFAITQCLLLEYGLILSLTNVTRH